MLCKRMCSKVDHAEYRSHFLHAVKQRAVSPPLFRLHPRQAVQPDHIILKRYHYSGLSTS